MKSRKEASLLIETVIMNRKEKVGCRAGTPKRTAYDIFIVVQGGEE